MLVLHGSDSLHTQLALTATGTVRAASIFRPPKRSVFDAAEVSIAAHGRGRTEVAVLSKPGGSDGRWVWRADTEGLGVS
jgi:hypothetical protein